MRLISHLRRIMSDWRERAKNDPKKAEWNRRQAEREAAQDRINHQITISQVVQAKTRERLRKKG